MLHVPEYKHSHQANDILWSEEFLWWLAILIEEKKNSLLSRSSCQLDHFRFRQDNWYVLTSWDSFGEKKVRSFYEYEGK